VNLLVVSNGKDLFQYMGTQNQYQKSAVEANGSNIASPYKSALRLWIAMELVQGFFVPQSIGMLPDGAAPTYAGKEKADGTEFDVIEVTTEQPVHATARYFLSPKDHLVHRLVRKVEIDAHQTVTLTAALKNVRTDAPVQAAAFRWTPPANAKVYTPPTLA